MLGNYNDFGSNKLDSLIIPLREMLGNYNPLCKEGFRGTNYTLERDVRELQLSVRYCDGLWHYTLERDVRELQP